MTVSKCKKCGAGCLEEEPPEDCNNCNPEIRALIAEAARLDEMGYGD